MEFSLAIRSLSAASACREAVFDLLIEHANGASDEDLAHLARVLAASGLQAPQWPNSSDVASSGGPSSLTMLLCPLYLRALGFLVPKVSVPGRPAGGIDVMGTIPGFRVDMPASLFAETVETAGMCHVRAGPEIAPLDGLLFDYRKRVGAISVPE